MKINLNQHIKVKLTDKAEIYLKKRHNKIYQQFANEVKFKMPNVDKEGYSTYQLWEFIGIFGDSMKYPTLKGVIETDIIIEEYK